MREVSYINIALGYLLSKIISEKFSKEEILLND